MHHLYLALVVRLRELRLPTNRDRGETGPIGYAFMVSAIVLLAVFVAAWGQQVVDLFTSSIEGVSPGGGGE